MRFRALAVLVLLAAVVAAGFLLVSDSDERATIAVAQRVVDVGCGDAFRDSDGQPASDSLEPEPGNAALGSLVLVGGSHVASRRQEAFMGNGYKLPVSLPEGLIGTLSVPPALRSRVGLVFSPEAQDRVLERGVSGADPAVRFVACPADGERGRTGWPGGIVVDRPRCATLIVIVSGHAPGRHRVPLGRPC